MRIQAYCSATELATEYALKFDHFRSHFAVFAGLFAPDSAESNPLGRRAILKNGLRARPRVDPLLM
jgi:hypothetical protein